MEMEMVMLLPSALKVCVIVCSHFSMFFLPEPNWRPRPGLNPAGRKDAGPKPSGTKGRCRESCHWKVSLRRRWPVCRRRGGCRLYAMMSLQCACCWPRDCVPPCRHAAARHARLKRPATLESFCNVYGERWRFSGGCLTGCVLRTCWRVLLTGRHVVFMWHNPRARHLGHQQVRGECALLFISDAIHIIWHTIACK